VERLPLEEQSITVSWVVMPLCLLAGTIVLYRKKIVYAARAGYSKVMGPRLEHQNVNNGDISEIGCSDSDSDDKESTEESITDESSTEGETEHEICDPNPNPNRHDIEDAALWLQERLSLELPFALSEEM
jgi:hypothetical protein